MINQAIFKLQNILQDNEAALITSDCNRRYLTGFKSSAGLVAVLSNAAYFLIDFRYFEKAKKTVGEGVSVELSKNPESELSEIFKKHGIKYVFPECENVSLSTKKRWAAAFEGIEILEDDKVDRLLYKMRSIKNEQEISYIIEAQKIADNTFSHILNFISEGKTEREIALEIEFNLRCQGSEGAAFETIAISGENTSMPHGVPTDRKIKKGDLITMDFGAVVNGYRSDMTRTVAVGSVDPEKKQVYDTVLAAQLAALEGICPGTQCCEIDRIARDLIDSAGYAGCFGHALGHSVGLEIHESPSFSPRCKTKLEPGMIITVEPGIYIESQFGVRIEDFVVVTKDGYRNLTGSKKEFIQL